MSTLRALDRVVAAALAWYDTVQRDAFEDPDSGSIEALTELRDACGLAQRSNERTTIPYHHEVYAREITDPQVIAARALASARAHGFEPVGTPTIAVDVVRYIVTWPDRAPDSSTVPTVT